MIDKILLDCSVRLLTINDQVEIEWDNIVTNFKTVIQMELLIPIVEDILILHSEHIESNLGETCVIGFSNDSRSEVSLFHRCQEILVKFVFLRWICDQVDSLLANRSSKYEHGTDDSILFVELSVHLHRSCIKGLSGDESGHTNEIRVYFVDFAFVIEIQFDLVFENLME